MAIGPGKYDDLCSEVRQKSDADAAFIIVINGNKGSGFSCQILGHMNNIINIANILEEMAKEIKSDHANLVPNV